MHDTALVLGAAFFHVYGAAGPVRSIVEVGSNDVNGSLRNCAPRGVPYLGLDLAPGPGVDLIVEPGSPWNIVPESADLVVSSSCLEHDPLFWLTFLEMARVLSPTGYLYLNVPSKGPYHGYPVDCWRFYGDAGRALGAWARMNSIPIGLLESFQVGQMNDVWNDQVMVFGGHQAERVRPTLADFISDVTVHVRP